MSKSADKNLKFCQIVMIKIVSSRTLWNLSIELVTTDFVTDFVTNSTDNYILSARVRRPLVCVTVIL